jgi:hypothetical protein
MPKKQGAKANYRRQKNMTANYISSFGCGHVARGWKLHRTVCRMHAASSSLTRCNSAFLQSVEWLDGKPTGRQQSTGPIPFTKKTGRIRDHPGWKRDSVNTDGKLLIPFPVPVPVHPVPFSAPFPLIPQKTKTDGKIQYTVVDGTWFIPSVFIFR